ncbi:MAG: sulfatase, partial [Acidobacteriota bacterium]
VKTYNFMDDYHSSNEKFKARAEEEIIWTFDFDMRGDAEGWYPKSGIRYLRVEEGMLKFTTFSSDPNLVINLVLDANQINVIRLRMKISAGEQGELLWGTRQFNTFASARKQFFSITADNKFHTYYIFTEDIPTWKGDIIKLRIDPTNAPALVEIDYISLLNMNLFRRAEIEQDTSFFETAFIGNETRRIIFSPPPWRMEKTLRLPQKAAFAFGFGILRNVWGSPGDGVQFSVKLTDQKRETHTLFSHYIDPKHNPQHRRWFDARVDLSAWGGKQVKLSIQTEGSSSAEPPLNRKPDLRYDYAVWSDSTVYSLDDEQEELNVVLIMLDTLRADALGCYGYRRPTSPNIDQLAENPHSVLFTRAFSSSPWTTPAHTSLFTSRHLSLTREYELKHLPPEELTLAQVMREAGYNTVAFTGGAYVSAKLGFHQGFDIYYETERLGKVEEVFTQFADWFEHRRRGKFFLFFHTFEVHTPYTRSTFINKNELGRIPAKFAENFVEVQNPDLINIIVTATEEEKRYIKALYDGGVYEADKYIGLILQKLEEKKLLGKTIIIITSDHGEEFWNHYPFGSYHGYSLYWEMLHVPLIIYAPGLELARHKIEEPISLLDLFPTIVDLLSLKGINQQRLMGTSLLPVMEGDGGYANYPILAELKDRGLGLRLQAIITDRYKYIRSLDGGKETLLKNLSVHINEEELYELRDDSLETRNLILDKPTLTKELQQMLASYVQQKSKLVPLTTLKEKEIDEELRKKLKALGYIKGDK